MDIANDADDVSVGFSPGNSAVQHDAPERVESETPADIRSSPPTMSVQAETSIVDDMASPSGAKTDSEAETVVLGGVNGHSPSNVRRAIKLEGEASGNGTLDGIAVEPGKRALNKEGAHSPNEVTTSRKRKRKTTTRDEYTGNSSGLSSVPSSPVDTTRSSLSKPLHSELNVSKSPSPDRVRAAKRRSIDKVVVKSERADNKSEDDKEQRKYRQRRSSGLEVSSLGKRSKDVQSTVHVDENPRKRVARSASPRSLEHRRSASRQLSTSSAATIGLSHKKKRIPAPLRSTKDRQSLDYDSDSSSSTGESPRPRRSHTRNLATPPTGDSSISLAKMAPHKRKADKFGRTPLMDACEDGDEEKVRKYLAESPEHIDQGDGAGNTPLQCASLHGHETIVKMLIDAGCNVDCYNDDRETPLLDAAENGHLKVVLLLLAAGANPRKRNVQGKEPIDKVNMDSEDAHEIRQALLSAKMTQGPAQLSAPIKSAFPEIAVEKNRGTQSRGRSTKTGEHQLYMAYDEHTVREKAAKGDYGAVATLIDTRWPNGGFDDPESVVAAARGGHDEVLEILLGLGGADPDPQPVQDLPSDQATPILAAIGGENIKVIKILSAQDDSRFDPTRKHNGKTYYEIAKDRAGPFWQEEEQILKAAFDRYRGTADHHVTRNSSNNHQQSSRSHQKKLSNSDLRSPPGKARRASVSEPAGRGLKRDSRGLNVAESTPVKRGPGRPRKEGHEHTTLERESTGPTTNRKHESHKDSGKRSDSESNVTLRETEPVKPKRKLISGKDRKDKLEKQRRDSIASQNSVTSPKRTVSLGDVVTTEKRGGTPVAQSAIRSDIDIDSDKPHDRARSIKREHSKDRRTAVRGDSPTKRPRSMTPPSEVQDSACKRQLDNAISNKRRRLETDSKSANRGAPGWSSSPDRATGQSNSGSEKTSVDREHARDLKRLPNIASEKNIPDDFRRSPSESRKTNPSSLSATDKVYKAKMGLKTEDSVSSSEEAAAAERKAKEAQELAEREAKAKKEAEERLEREKAELTRKAEQARLLREAAEQREREELAKREKEAAELRERQKKEEAEANRRAEEERRRLYDEQQRIYRENRERIRAEQIARMNAERERQQAEQEAARLAKLPALLRWFDGHPNPKTPEIASKFRVMQGVRYDTIKPEATGGPDAKEQWLSNFQVALLIGEKDLQLSRYTGWDRIPVSDLAKQVLWRTEFDRYSMIFENLRMYNPKILVPDGNGSSKLAPWREIEQMRAETKALFLQLDMFFIKVSDFMFIVPTFPHLKNIQLQVIYRELPPDATWLMSLTFPPKWKGDADAEANFGFAPGTKYYVNGEFVGEDKPLARGASKVPYPEKQVPRKGFREVFPGESDYEQLCIEQGLEHLLNGNHQVVNSHMILTNGNRSSPFTPPAETGVVTDESLIGNE